MSTVHSVRSNVSKQLHLFVSSEAALIAITPYDYPAAQRPLFEHTPVLDNDLNINTMMTLVTLITIMTEIDKITRNVK